MIKPNQIAVYASKGAAFVSLRMTRQLPPNTRTRTLTAIAAFEMSRNVISVGHSVEPIRSGSMRANTRRIFHQNQATSAVIKIPRKNVISVLKKVSGAMARVPAENVSSTRCHCATLKAPSKRT